MTRRLAALLLICTTTAVCGCSITEDVLVVGPGPSPWEEEDSGWVIEHPAFGSAQLLGARLGPGGRAWIVGSGGLLMGDDGHGWRCERAAGVASALLAVVDAGDVVLAAGENGVVLRRLGGDWTREDSGTNATLRALAMGPEGAVWAAGNCGVLLRRGASGWERVPAPLAGDFDLTALAVLGDTLVVGAASGAVLGYAEGGWRTLGDLAPLGVIGLAVRGDGCLFVSNGQLHRYRDGRWMRIEAQEEPLSYVAAAGNVLLYCGRSGSLLPRFVTAPADSWSWWGSVPSPTAFDVDAQGRVLAVGQGGGIRWRREGAWATDPAGAGLSWNVYPLRDGTCVLAGGGTIMVPHEGNWRPLAIDPAEVRTITSLDGFSAGDFTYCRRELVRIDSLNYVYVGSLRRHHWGLTQEIPLPAALAGFRYWTGTVVVDDAGALLFSGNVVGGDVWRYENGAWSQVLAPADSTYRWTLQRSAEGQVFAWDGRRVLCWDRVRWLDLGVIDGDGSLLGLRLVGRSPGPVVALFRDTWGLMESPPDGVWVWSAFPTRGLGFRGSGYAWAEGRSGLYLEDRQTHVIYRLDMSPLSERAWSQVTGPAREPMWALHVDSDGSLIGVGRYTGRICRHAAVAPPF